MSRLRDLTARRRDADREWHRELDRLLREHPEQTPAIATAAGMKRTAAYNHRNRCRTVENPDPEGQEK